MGTQKLSEAIEPSSIVQIRDLLAPFRLYWYSTVESTNTEAARLLQLEEAKPPFVVFTESQTHGRGRGSNTWESPRGVLTATFVIPSNPLIPPNIVPLLAGLTVRDALSDLGATSVGLKWPNDVWANGLKVAGLLCERVAGGDLIGVGVNVCNATKDLPSSIAGRSTSLTTLVNKEISISETLQVLAKKIAAYLIDSRYPISQTMEWYSDYLVIRGRKIRVSDYNADNSFESIEGYCQGIDERGRLVVTNNNQRHTIISGHVTLID
jgi:BirA family transcriptional regulator, biotin operon repressor / biotin---[acetyl-CoA-carboxylase] ligase